MFPASITEMWQQKIRNIISSLGNTNIQPSKYEVNLNVYVDLRNMINHEYAIKVKNYRELLEK
jgi:uncharacterized protein YutE (UPF0331/DUF86 family)